MYQLVSRIQDGLGELKSLLETHIHSQGLAAVEKLGESAMNVSTVCGRDVSLPLSNFSLFSHLLSSLHPLSPSPPSLRSISSSSILYPAFPSLPISFSLTPTLIPSLNILHPSSPRSRSPPLHPPPPLTIYFSHPPYLPPFRPTLPPLLLPSLPRYPVIHKLLQESMFYRFVQDPKTYVQTILDVHKKFNALVMTAFNNDAGFVAALDKVGAGWNISDDSIK